MVRSKAPPRHADMREFYLLDQQARETKYQAEYKRHVHMPAAPPAITTSTKNVTNR